MFTTKGPIITLCNISEEIHLKENQHIELTSDPLNLNKSFLQCDYPQLCQSVKVGSSLIMCNKHDPEVRFEITKVDRAYSVIIIKALNEGKITPHPHTKIFLPFVDLQMPTITSEDEKTIEKFVLKEGVDMIALSYVRSHQDISEIRDTLGPRGSLIKIIAKIDNIIGLQNFDEILAESDGIMIARGRLCYELPEEKLFKAQKLMIEKAKRAIKPVITSTQMLESMTFSHRPTLAEVTDVANAVIDGSDCVLLSNETAKGIHPLEALETMIRICVEAEQCIYYIKSFELAKSNIISSKSDNLSERKEKLTKPEVICRIAVSLAEDMGASLIVVITETGLTVRLLAKYRPKQIILALCVSTSVIRQLKITRGVISLKIPSFLGCENLIKQSIFFAKENGYIHQGDKIICILGEYEETPDYANTIKITNVC